MENSEQETNGDIENVASTAEILIKPENLPINISDKALLIEASDKAVEIFKHIKKVSERIQEAKQDSEHAKKMESGWFGKTGKKTDATATALVKTNEAIVEMNDLIQEAVKFSCRSVEYSTVMIQAMSQLIANGFKNSNGEIIKLNQSGEEFANIILSQADEFTNKHLEIKRLQEQQQKNVVDLKNHSDTNDEKLASEISRLEKESHKKDAELSDEIHQKTTLILNKSDENDALHDQQIGELHEKTSEVLFQSDANDLKHDQQIKELFDLVKNLQQKNAENEKAKTTYQWLTVISLLISTVAIVLVTVK